jgi:uncharacterized protein YecA (UPF0149 family)
MNDRQRKALEWYARAITEAKVAAGHVRATKNPSAYRQYIFNKFAHNADRLKTIAERYQESCDRGEL